MRKELGQYNTGWYVICYFSYLVSDLYFSDRIYEYSGMIGSNKSMTVSIIPIEPECSELLIHIKNVNVLAEINIPFSRK